MAGGRGSGRQAANSWQVWADGEQIAGTWRASGE